MCGGSIKIWTMNPVCSRTCHHSLSQAAVLYKGHIKQTAEREILPEYKLGRFARASAAGRQQTKPVIIVTKTYPNLMACWIRGKFPINLLISTSWTGNTCKRDMCRPLPCCSCCSFVGRTLCSQALETEAARPECPTTVQSAARKSWRLQPGSDSACGSPVLWLCWQHFPHSLSLSTT